MPRQPHSAEAVTRPNRPRSVLAGVRFPAPAYTYLVIALVGAGFAVGTVTPPLVCSTSIRRPGRAGLMANAPATRKTGVCEDAVLTLDRSTRSASLPQL